MSVKKQKALSVCVFSGTQSGQNLSFVKLGEKLGKILAKRKFKLVFGGGTTGIMSAVATSARSNHGTTIGILPNFMIKEYKISSFNELVIVDTLHARKSIMYSLGDAYIALPGGLGTCEEIIEVISAKNLGLHKKPIVLLGPKRYWAPFINYIKYLNKVGFLDNSIFSLFFQTLNIDKALCYINENYKLESSNNWFNITKESILQGQQFLL